MVAIDDRIRETLLQIVYQRLPFVSEGDLTDAFYCRRDQYPTERAAGQRKGNALALACPAKYLGVHAERRARLRVKAPARIESGCINGIRYGARARELTAQTPDPMRSR